MKGVGLIRPDAIGLPYGDLAHDDDACSRFLKTKREMYELGKFKRKYFKSGRMSKRDFDEWKRKSMELGDDTPLRNILPTEL